MPYSNTEDLFALVSLLFPQLTGQLIMSAAVLLSSTSTSHNLRATAAMQLLISYLPKTR